MGAEQKTYNIGCDTVENIHFVANYQFAIARLIENNGAVACRMVSRFYQVQSGARQRIPDQLTRWILANGRNEVDIAC